MSIAFIAPYESLAVMARQIIDERHYPIRVYQADIRQGVAAARRALAEGAKILISRGGTALRISEELGIDVGQVRPSVYSAFAFIHAQTAPDSRIAIVGFNSLISICTPVCDILRRRYQAFEFRYEHQFADVMESLVAWKPDVIIGDVVSVRLTRARGLDCHLIESSKETLVEAFEQAMLALNNMNRLHASEKKLVAVLQCTREGALLLDGGRRVEEINQRGCSLLHASREEVIGRPFHQIFPDADLNAAVTKAMDLQNSLTRVGDRHFVVDLVRSPMDMSADSIVVLFQRVEQIQQTEKSIRSKLMDSGFCAKYTFDSIVHASAAMREAIDRARRYSVSDSNILIEGETGTGKELFAQSIHNASARAKGPFVAVNCAALPGTLLESELFGYAPGAFTGALRSGKTGLFELAHNGTLFLDEVAEMDVFLQARLLRTLQAREIMRIGDNKVISVNVRIIAATNKDTRVEVRQGRLREDIYYRLSVLDLEVPPLRERKGDAALLFRHFLDLYGGKYGWRPPLPGARFLQAIEDCPWHGNVRALENFAEKYVTLRGLPETAIPARTAPVDQDAEPASLDAAIIHHVQSTLKKEEGNIARTATRLRVDRNTVKRWLAKRPEEKQS
ncbi:sigma 54-interacting transcriptional regulator [Xanthobacteraceae bacterium Astr-EGSB]|uniref:sigma 54-interacting transcriptional regulator n=1 Tax=Astrobacterium formosum TaxID=3069710 RepID=UPI0027B6FDF6|nr:sigma 54-interacting transcriptional regulator [Xanthobacteraceae bacterium Astr-EGSB]